MRVQLTLRSNKQLVDELRRAPEPWVDTAIVVAFENRFEFVGEDHLDPVEKLRSLQEEGGLPIGLAGLKPGATKHRKVLSTQVFREYIGQPWAHRYMEILDGIYRSH